MPSSIPRNGSLSRRSSTSGPYVPQPESLILPDGAVSSQAAELLEDLTNPHYDDIDADADYHLRKEHAKHLPWWKTPSPWWLLAMIPFTSIAMAATIAPKIEIYTLLACSVHKPEILQQTLNGSVEHHPIDTLLIYPIIPRGYSNYDFDTSQLFTLPLPAFQNDTHTPKPIICASDPVVQAAVAKLSTDLVIVPFGSICLGFLHTTAFIRNTELMAIFLVISACMGILCCLTTGWWGAFSDRRGRTRVMGISIVGLLITDFNFIMVSRNFQRLPGGYWFLVVGPLIEGFLGGSTSAIAAMHAYIADTTTEATRSRTFSLSLGLLFTGIALGPTLGALLIHFTGQTLSVFYAAGMMHLTYALFVWFIIPESLLEQQMRQSRLKYDEELRVIAVDRTTNPAAGLLVRFKRLFTFLSPLTVFLPEIKERGPGDNPLKCRRDWNLTLLAASYGLSVSIMGSYIFKFQYAASTFGWTSETLGYWLSLVGTARAAFLTLVLPVIIRILKPQPLTIELPVKPTAAERQPLLHNTASSTYHAIRPVTPDAPLKTFKKQIHSPAFDIGLAHGSLFIEVIAYTLMAFVPTAKAFTLSSMLGSMGAGFSPATQSVALAMYTRRGGTESGRLFGALSVVQALCSQILGPALYGLVYMKTVATLPRTIFFVSMGTIAISFILLSLVRVPRDHRLAPKHSDPLFSSEGVDEETRVGSE